eukprot:scaffold9286_cov76-Phaeocystis_antarctica.AAC.2
MPACVALEQNLESVVAAVLERVGIARTLRVRCLILLILRRSTLQVQIPATLGAELVGDQH